MNDLVGNPYVGPRPFEEADGDRFFGRDREISQLASLVVARRVVVLYARSGAGKTSLLRAGLIPHLRQRKKLRVLPVARVGGESPQVVAPQTIANLYALNVLFDLFGDRIPSGELVPLTLAEGLERSLAEPSGQGTPGPCLLILDQLEELFGVHPELHEQRADLFVQLRRSLDKLPQLSLLLSLREDSIAELDAYAALFPDRLRSRFRLELLAEEEARQAMQRPAQDSGGGLGDAAAQQLVDELRTVRIQRSDGRGEKVLGPWVEPVHLQVICQRLWRRQATADGGPRRLEALDLETAGTVDDALTGYYDEQVAAAAAETGQQERTLRDWIEHQLITAQGIRGQMLKGVKSSEGLSNQVILALVEARLVRVEKRRGATWFELAHDRLVAPVRSSNAVWRRLHLRPVQRRTNLWVREGRPHGLLLRSSELRRELAWAKKHREELTTDEKQFLAAARQGRRTRRLGWLVLAGILVLAASLWLFQQERQKSRRELARGLAAQAMSQLGERLDLGLLLSLEATRLSASGAEAHGSLLASLQHQPRLESFLHGHTAAVWTLAFSPQNNADGKTVLASGGLDHQILLWDIGRHQRLGAPLEGHTDGVLSLAWSPDGRRLVSTGRDRQMLLWDLGQNPPRRKVLSQDRMVTSAVFRDRDHLVTGDTDHEVLVWNLAQNPPQSRLVGQHADWVTSLAVHPKEPRLLASGGADNLIRVWADGAEAAQELAGHSDWVSGLAWSPDGRTLASASLDRTVRRWDMETFQALGEPLLEGPSNRISGVAIGPDGKILAATTANGLIYLWDLDTGLPLGPPMPGNLALMRSLAFSPDGRVLATGNGPSVALWDVTELAESSGLGRPLSGGRGEVRRVIFSPDGSAVAVSVGGEAAEIRLLDAETGELRGEPLGGYPAAAHGIAWSPDGRTLAEFGDDEEFKEVRLWDLTRLESTIEVREEILSGIGQDPDRRALQRVGDFARTLERALEPRRTEDCVTVRTMAFTADGSALAVEGAPTPSAGGWVERWDVATGQAQDRAVEATECVRSLAISPDGEILAVGTDEGAIALLAGAGLEPQGLLEAHVLPVRSLAISPDGELLASGGDEGIIRLWALSSRTPRGRPLVGHSDTIYALSFGPEGRVLASAGRDRTVMLWDMATGGLPLGQPLRGHSGPVWSLTWSPDGERLASGGEDGTRLWELGFESWRRRACRIANRNLTQEEWDLFIGSAIPRGELACPEILQHQ